MKNFLYDCALEGVAEYIYNRRIKGKKITKPPIWMRNDESKAWKIGYQYARNACSK